MLRRQSTAEVDMKNASLNNNILQSSAKLTVPQRFLNSAVENLDRSCLFYLRGHTFEFVTYKRLLNLVENLTISLKQLGVKNGDRVAILSENRPELIVSDISVLSLSAISVPLHITLSSVQIREMIYELDPRLIIVSEKRLLKKLINIKKDIDKNVVILYYNIDLEENLADFKNDRCHFIEALRMNPHKNFSTQYREIIYKAKAKDTACIIYTLRPSGKYLGAELTHDNLISNYESTYEAFPVGPQDRLLSVLPLSHAFERTAGYYLPILSGSSIVYPQNLANISQAMKEYNPTVIMGVPYIYEKVSENISKKAKSDRISSFFFDKAFDSNDTRISKIANIINEKIVYKKVRKALGGNIRALISGGAPLSERTAKFFNACNVPILEGYGMTELSPIVSFNRENSNKLGTVGIPLSNVEVKIADDGEILVKSPGTMKGYFKDSVDTPKSFSEDGWFKTGDYGVLDQDGFLKITGLKKELIVLATGKKVSPVAIENKLIESKYIKTAKVYSRDNKTLSADIVLDKISCNKQDIAKNSLPHNKDINILLKKEIDKLLDCFASYEQIRDFSLAYG